MILSFNEIPGSSLKALDGSIGSVYDLYFDIRSWDIRYFVVDTSHGPFGKEVLIAPQAFQPWKEGADFRVNLTREQVKSSPDVDTAKPLDREVETMLFGHYGWLPYWAIGLMPSPPLIPQPEAEVVREAETVAERMPGGHLHSCRDLIGYRLEASDGSVGTVDDLLIDLNAMIVRYLAIDTGEKMSPRRVLLLPAKVSAIDWAGSKISARLSSQEILHSPSYDAHQYV